MMLRISFFALAAALLIFTLPVPPVLAVELATGVPVLQTSASAPAHWPYPVPLPTLEAPEAASMPNQIEGNSIRRQVKNRRRAAETVIDGYARKMEDCRFEATLHFDDQVETGLIGNDQACQSRYQRLMDEERRSLKRQLRKIRSEHANDALHPVGIR